MVVHLSTLKAGDSIKLRNGDLHEVLTVRLSNRNTRPYAITTTKERLYSYSNKTSYVWYHYPYGTLDLYSERPGDIVEIIPAEKNNMVVDLSTLKEGDSIKLRNGDVHKVTLINKTGSAYNVEYGIGTKNIRIIAGTDRRQYSGHFVTGHCGINQEQPGDIVEIIPNTIIKTEVGSLNYGRGDWNFGPREENVSAGVEHSISWLKKEVDKINNPNHYQSENGKQLWDLMPDMGTKEEFLGYCKFNVIKYVNRYNKKNGIEDLRKAIKYCERMVEFLENGK